MAGFKQALMFGVGVAVVLYGVRTVLGELVPAFQGIAAKVVPGAKAALDSPIVFPFGANAVLIGFLSSFTGGLIALGILALWLNPAFGLALILPGMVPHFFKARSATPASPKERKAKRAKPSKRALLYSSCPVAPPLIDVCAPLMQLPAHHGTMSHFRTQGRARPDRTRPWRLKRTRSPNRTPQCSHATAPLPHGSGTGTHRCQGSGLGFLP